MRIRELNDWIKEEGAHDHMGRPFRKTASAIDMRQFNTVINRRAKEIIKYLSREFH